MQDLLHAAAEQRRAQLVSVTGMAGIGKTRLSWELEKYVDGLADDFLWHRGRCLSYGDGVAFWALAEMVRMRARISEEDGADEARAKLAHALEEHLPAEDERDWVRPALLHLLGLEALPEGDRGRLFAAWRLFIERMADSAPVMLVFEDMQWADQALLDFLEYLLEWSRDLPLFVLALARPELADLRPGWGAASRSHTSLVLEPLTGPVMRELLAAMRLPAEVIEPDRRARRGDSALRRRDRSHADRPGRPGRRPRRGFEAGAEVGRPEIPETLHALVLARLDALPAASTGGCSRTRRCWARRSPPTAWPRSAASPPRRSHPGWSCWCAGSCSRSTPIRVRRSAGSTGSSRRSSGRSPTRPWACATASVGTWRRPPT